MTKKASRKFSLRFVLLAALIFTIIGAAVYFNYVWYSKRTEVHFDEGWYDTFNLKNGMQVVVIPNHKIPAVAHMVWYKVGAMDELRGKSGIAHFLEHLMFKGTKKYRDGAFSKVVALNGGKENAFTGHDYTAYFQTISKDKLPLVMELEADRMKNLILSEEDVEKELQVIIEERNMRTDNEPRALLREQLYAALYQNHPYGVPVIGWLHEMENLTREDALKHYRTYYAPNNAVLVIAGDVTSAEIKKLAQKYYGRLKKSDLPQRPDLAEPPQRAARSLVMEDSRVKEPEWWRIYYAPSYNQDKTEMYYPLVVLSKILGEGNLSRLYQRLVVEKKLATMIGTSYSGLSRGPGDFTFYALPAKGVGMEELQQAVDAEIAAIVKEGIEDDELKSAKKTLIVSEIYDREGLQSLAYAVGELIAVGADPEYITNWSDRINAVTPEQVQEAAEYVFDKRNSVTGVLKHGQ